MDWSEGPHQQRRQVAVLLALGEQSRANLNANPS